MLLAAHVRVTVSINTGAPDVQVVACRQATLNYHKNDSRMIAV